MRSVKGRTAGAILTEARVREMRLRGLIQKESTRSLALDFGVGQETVRRILRYESWGWVTDEGPGAEAHEWTAQKPTYVPAPGEVEASQARLLALIGGQAPTDKPMPTMAESMAAAARESDAVAARGLAALAKHSSPSQGDALLAGLLGTNGIPLETTPAITGTDGGKP